MPLRLCWEAQQTFWQCHILMCLPSWRSWPTCASSVGSSYGLMLPVVTMTVAKYKTSDKTDEEGKIVRSCTEIKKLCIQNETCNRLLVPRLSACPEDPAQCNTSRCQMAVQRFYEKLPFNMAEMLAFCDCSAVDDDCLHLKRSFHDRMCSGDITPSSTCIDVLDRCMADAACRHRFDAFHSKCWSEGQEVCNGSKDCRAAFIATRGTVLQIPCTCKGLERSHWSKCKHFQSLFHGKSCFGTLNFIMECTRLTGHSAQQSSPVLSIYFLQTNIKSSFESP
uniref:GDNF family receptor alpha like n=1 Tax=Erpetoichthys calabaricus TaxID=27687 RepID=A0A8C4TGM7_ERPCA